MAIVFRTHTAQSGRMKPVADKWWSQDRRDLFRAVETIAGGSATPDRIGQCLHALLDELEIFDDPRQGEGAFLHADEVEPLTALGVVLAAITGPLPPLSAGPTALAHPEWQQLRSLARDLAARMRRNGDFIRPVPRDYAIIFGAAVRGGVPSLTLRNRIDGALAWAQDNPDTMFIPTGAMGVEGHVEAYVIERALIHGGIDRDRIVAEPRGRDTLESVRYCDAILRDRGDCRAVVCCTSTYHQPRCALLLRLLGYTVVVPPMPNDRGSLSRRAYGRSLAKEVLGTPYDSMLLLGRRAVRRWHPPGR